MQYDIKYRIISTINQSISRSESNIFPVLEIKYRKSGTALRWISLGSAEIDLFAYIRLRNTYYKDLSVRRTPLDAIRKLSDYDRLTRFMEILNKEFAGSMDQFVKSLVKEEIAMKNAELEERQEVDSIVSSILAQKWKIASVSVN